MKCEIVKSTITAQRATRSTSTISGLLAICLSVRIDRSQWSNTQLFLKNKRGIAPVVRHLQFHKTILKSKIPMYYLGYLIVSMQILTVNNMRTTRDSMPKELPRSMTHPTDAWPVDIAIFHNISLGSFVS